MPGSNNLVERVQNIGNDAVSAIKSESVGVLRPQLQAHGFNAISDMLPNPGRDVWSRYYDPHLFFRDSPRLSEIFNLATEADIFALGAVFAVNRCRKIKDDLAVAGVELQGEDQMKLKLAKQVRSISSQSQTLIKDDHQKQKMIARYAGFATATSQIFDLLDLACCLAGDDELGKLQGKDVAGLSANLFSDFLQQDEIKLLLDVLGNLPGDKYLYLKMVLEDCLYDNQSEHMQLRGQVTAGLRRIQRRHHRAKRLQPRGGKRSAQQLQYGDRETTKPIKMAMMILSEESLEAMNAKQMAIGARGYDGKLAVRLAFWGITIPIVTALGMTAIQDVMSNPQKPLGQSAHQEQKSVQNEPIQNLIGFENLKTDTFVQIPAVLVSPQMIYQDRTSFIEAHKEKFEGDNAQNLVIYDVNIDQTRGDLYVPVGYKTLGCIPIIKSDQIVGYTVVVQQKADVFEPTIMSTFSPPVDLDVDLQKLREIKDHYPQISELIEEFRKTIWFGQLNQFNVDGQIDPQKLDKYWQNVRQHDLSFVREKISDLIQQITRIAINDKTIDLESVLALLGVKILDFDAKQLILWQAQDGQMHARFIDVSPVPKPHNNGVNSPKTATNSHGVQDGVITIVTSTGEIISLGEGK